MASEQGAFLVHKLRIPPGKWGKEIKMAFTPIETQEQFDAAIGERLKRDREAYAKRFEGWMSPEDLEKLTADHNAKIKALEDAAAATQQTIADKDAQLAESARYRTDLEKTRIALAAGLKIEYADRLMGSTAEEWKADAEALAKDFAAAHPVAPLGSPEPIQTGDKTTRAQFANWMAEQLNN